MMIQFLTRIDRLLVEVATGAKQASQGVLEELARAILLYEAGDRVPQGASSIDALFLPVRSAPARALTTAALLRLLPHAPIIHQNVALKHKVIQLCLTELPDQVFRLCRIRPKDQTHLIERGLADYVHAVESRFESLVASPTTVDSVAALRSAIPEHFHNPANAPLIRPFLPPVLYEKARLVELPSLVLEYRDAPTQGKVAARDRALRVLREFQAEADAFRTQYSRKYLAGLAASLSRVLEGDFAASPLSRPAQLRLDAATKRYPLHVLGNPFEIRLTLDSIGAGHAQSITLHASSSSQELILPSKELFLGDLGPGERVGDIRIRGQMTQPAPSVGLQATITWVNTDGVEHEASWQLKLEAQRTDVDWVSLQRLEPFDLNPVPNAQKLAGRKELLARLAARARSESIGSVVLHGQRRIGKTSVARVFKQELETQGDSSILVVYIESGEYISNTGEVTLQRLGTRLCDEIKESHPALQDIQVPAFVDGLSPLVDFLRVVQRRRPELRLVVILDEFDTLPIELFKRGPVGDALFQTLRSVSGHPQRGFVLIGGENMELVLSSQGQALNKFSYERLDSFNRDNDWSDYAELIRAPFSPWFEIAEEAIVFLYEQTAGNPFFTKLICGELFRLMVKRRDSHITLVEAEEAFRLTVRSAGPNKFQHFWEDGIADRGVRQEDVSLRRRQVLLGLAEATRRRDATSERVVLASKGATLSESDVRQELDDFMRRGVLRLVDGEVRCTVPLFGEWLRERGVQEISTTVADPDSFFAQKRQDEEARVSAGDIVALCERWPAYRGVRIGEERVRAWLDQVKEVQEQRLLFRLLQGMRFYGDGVVRAHFRTIHGAIEAALTAQGIAVLPMSTKQKRTEFRVCYLGLPGKSGAQLARMYADENRISADRIAELSDAQADTLRSSGVRVLVVVDDFIGTGNTIATQLTSLSQRTREALKDQGIHLFVAAAVGFPDGITRVESEARRAGLDVTVHVGETVDEADLPFSATSRLFPDRAERERARDLVTEIGAALVSKNPLGFGDCGGLIVFERQCPNNTLPILWKESTRRPWKPLFARNL
jgi:hypothetical protein